jgi:hypothetical protein
MRAIRTKNQNRRCPDVRKSHEPRLQSIILITESRQPNRPRPVLRSEREPSPRRGAEFTIEPQPSAMQAGYSRQEVLHTSETLEFVLDFSAGDLSSDRIFCLSIQRGAYPRHGGTVDLLSSFERRFHQVRQGSED